MKHFIYIICLVFLFSCQEKDSFTLLSGTIKGTDVKEIELEGVNFSKKISIEDNGTFTDTLDLPYDGMYYLLLSDEKSYYIYLEKGFNLQFETAADDFVNTMKYSGTGQEENNYLIQKNTTLCSKVFFMCRKLLTNP